jgi:hypothetical protein
MPFLVLATLAWLAANQPMQASAAQDDADESQLVVAPEPVEAFSTFHHALAREDYSAARVVIDSLKTMRDPLIKPWMRILRATLTIAAAVDFGIEEKENLFHSDLKAATRAIEWTLTQEGEASPNLRKASLHAALGTINLLDAQWENEIDGDILKAMGPAGRGYDEMELAYALDESRMDALLGIAAYRFYKSNTLKFLTWMPFMKDEREQSLLNMRLVMDTPGPSQPSAVTTLAWALIEMDRSEEAAEVCPMWLQELDNPRYLLEPYAKAQFVAENWDQARVAYDIYLDEIRSAARVNMNRLLGALSRAVQTARQQQDWSAVAVYCEEALSQPLTEDEWKQYREFRDGFDRYREQAEEYLATQHEH